MSLSNKMSGTVKLYENNCASYTELVLEMMALKMFHLLMLAVHCEHIFPHSQA